MGEVLKYNHCRLVMFFMLFFVAGIQGMNGQETLILNGQIQDQANNNILPGVTVSISNTKGSVSDIDGQYQLKLVPGDYEVQFKMLGYKTETRSIKLTTNQRLDIRLSESSLLLDQVVISASRFEQNMSEVTVSMEVLQPELLQNRNITTLDDALRESPGMIIVDDEPQIRSGSGYSFGAGSRVQILMDGVPQLSGDVGRPTWANIPMEAVDQIEVIKGASSVLYGTSALSGVVHVRTMYPGASPKTRIEAYGGGYARPQSMGNRYWESANLISGRTILHSQQLGNSDLIFSVDLLSDDGALGPIVDSLDQIIPSSGAADDPNYYEAERRARLWMKYRCRNQKIPGLVYGISLNGQKNASVATLLWDNTETGLYKAFAGSATVTRQTVSNVNPFIEYRRSNGNSIIYRGNWNKLDNANTNNQNNFSDTYFNEVQLLIDGKSYGITGLKNTLGFSTTRADSDSEIFNNEGKSELHTAENIGFYFQSDYKVTKRLTTSAGIRWEQLEIDGEKDAQPVFRAGANYHLGQATYVRASYGQGYRFPTIGERFITTTVGILNIYPNADLQPETSSNMELGIKQGFSFGAFKGYADLAVFRQDIHDFIEFTFGQWADTASIDNFLGLGFTSLNTGEASVMGLEVSIAAQGDIGAKSSLSLLAGYTYASPKSESPDYVYAQSETTGSTIAAFQEVSFANSSSDPSNDILKYRMQHIARINADLKKGRFNIGAGLRYNSFMQNIDGIFEELDDGASLGGTLPSGVSQWRKDNNKGNTIVDARMGYRFYKDHSASLVVDNLLNQEYAIRPLALESSRRVLLRFSFQF